MKKLLCLMLTLVFAIGALAGCVGSVDDQDAELGAFQDDGSEKLEISWLGYATLAGCSEGTASEKLLEEKFNVELKPIFAENANYTDKKNALLQSGEIPDLIYELDPAHVFADARDEYLFQLQYDVIKKYAPSIFADISDRAPAAWAYSYYDGKNYGLPNLNNTHEERAVVVYRKDWLDKVGMDVPETLDDLHDVLLAFTKEDPDGNGKNDTYGYNLSSTQFQGYFDDIFGAYGVLPFDWQEVNGEIVYGGLRPETVEVLKILNNWYDEGIIYPGFVELDKGAGDLFNSNLMGYGVRYGYEDHDLPTSTLSTLKKKAPDAELVYDTLVKGPKGDYGVRSWGYPCHVVGFGANGDDAPKKITRMLKMFEAMYTDEALLSEIRFGKEGETYIVEDGKTTMRVVPTEEYSDPAVCRLAGYEFNASGPTFWTPFAPSLETTESLRTTAYNEFREKYIDLNANLKDVFYKVDIVPSAPTYIVDIRNQQMTLMSKVIKGEIAADKYIEEFTKIWNGTGGEQLLKEAREQKNILNDIYKEIGIN